ncbi:hydroxyisourate hydrolase [Nesterenkonia sp. NBAIMH1]|uniref:hydroxyisourate hydrolase n=1 Tax=Nesterenkonia sp. NBAIMH1 TaxID=2600320 RepID=UPI0011B57FF6|nr:hydroxyisourate hydrolase [Nesterenkonia sp. NBAIMH1]
MSLITTHVLDSSTGSPARGIAVSLTDAAGEQLGAGVTDADGRVSQLGPEALDPGTYRLRFITGEYFASRNQETFFPEVLLAFQVSDAAHYHVPLLLSPFAYSTYRGS